MEAGQQNNEGSEETGGGAAVSSATRTLRARAYDAITHRLLAAEIAPGQFVTQRQLVALTGMPLGAIRETIPRLEAEGILKTVPQRGMQIADVDLNLIRNAFQLRLVLEREGLIHFCTHASDSEIARIHTQHEVIAKAAQTTVTEALASRAQAVDWGFHEALIDSLGNDLISSAYRVNNIKIRLIRNRETRIFPALIAGVLEEHLSIIQALRQRDRVGAVAALEDHIESARRRALHL